MLILCMTEHDSSCRCVVMSEEWTTRATLLLLLEPALFFISTVLLSCTSSLEILLKMRLTGLIILHSF